MDSFSAAQLARYLEQTPSCRLVDVREKEEWEHCRLPQAEWIPLSEFARCALERLPKEQEIILYCHHGIRSLSAGQFLLSHGYSKVSHLAGGIDAWSLEVDSSVKRY
jgi:sulfur-carrier protein adenylyltransferase/sulfurtransferase